MKNYTGSADRSKNGSLIVVEKVTYRGLTKRQYLRDVELKVPRRKRITLPNIVEKLEQREKQFLRREAERFIRWRESRA